MACSLITEKTPSGHGQHLVQYVALRLSMPQAFHCLPIVKAHLGLGCSYRSILNVSRLRSFISIGTGALPAGNSGGSPPHLESPDYESTSILVVTSQSKYGPISTTDIKQ